MPENKIIKYEVELLSTNKRLNYHVAEIFTNDLFTNEFQFHILDLGEQALASATSDILLTMRDGSHFNNEGQATRSGNVFKYVLKENEGKHYGVATIQLVVNIGGKRYATPLYNFAIMQGLDDKVSNEVVINDLNSETRKEIAKIKREAVLSFENLSTQFQQVIEGTSGKDVISAPEIIAARGKYANLSERLGKADSEIANLNNFVSFNMFGVNSQEKFYDDTRNRYYLDKEKTIEYTDNDAVGIREAITYANENNLPIINKEGHYVLKVEEPITIKVSADFGQTVFHVDESATVGGLFIVDDENSWKTESKADFPNLKNSLYSGNKEIPAFSDYNNHLFLCVNSDEIVGKRNGSGGVAKRDLVVVGKNGSIESDITWNNYSNITSIESRKLPDGTLVISGGSFLLNGKLNDIGVVGNYKKTGFIIKRSFVQFENQRISFEGEEAGNGNSDGFYYADKVTNLTYKNISIPPRTSTTGEGTYQFGGRLINRLTLDSVTSEIDIQSHGIMGTNEITNLTIRDCSLNRIDTHFHLFNLFVENSKVGTVRIEGGGLLVAKDNTFYSDTAFNFREDYGSIWNGDIVLENNLQYLNGGPDANIMAFYSSNVDYGQDIIYGRSIIVKKHTAISSGYESEINIINFGFNYDSPRKPIQYPSNLVAKGLFVRGGSKGYNLIKISQPNKIITGLEGGILELEMDSVSLKTNAYYHFENVDTMEKAFDPNKSENYHFTLNYSGNYTLENAIIPQVKIIDCNHVNVLVWSSAVDLSIENCTIGGLNANSGSGQQRSKISIDRANFLAKINTADYTFTAVRIGNGQVDIKNTTFHPDVVLGVKNYRSNNIFLVNYNNKDVYNGSPMYINCRIIPSWLREMKTNYGGDTAPIDRLVDSLLFKKTGYGSKNLKI